MNQATGILRATWKYSLTLGMVFAMCLMAFASLGGTASAHSHPRHSHACHGHSCRSHPRNVQVNGQACNQAALGEAQNHALTATKQTQACLLLQKNGSESGNGRSSRRSNVQINIQYCNQIGASKAQHAAATATNQTQTCVFAQKK